jgi:hypothetical protein
MGFVGEGFALFVKYEDAVYNEKKAEILNSTTFLDAPVIDRYGDYQFPVTKFFYKNYDIRIISDWKYSQPNCKSFGMIGFDDENNSIVYCYYCDFDLDLIAEKDEDPETEMYEFMNDSFEWKQ